MKLPESSIITREESERRRRESKHHTVVVDGNFAVHSIFDAETGIMTIVDAAETRELP